MRIGSIDYSSKATKLIAALMVCCLVFTLAIPAQPADAAAGVALAAGLTLAFVAACGVAFTVNEAQNSSTYWEGQIDSYLAESGLSDVGEWVDFGSVIYDSASGKLRYPGEVLSGLLDFFSWFTGKNGIEAGGTTNVNVNSFYDSISGMNIPLTLVTSSYGSSVVTVDSFGLSYYSPNVYRYTIDGNTLELNLSGSNAYLVINGNIRDCGYLSNMTEPCYLALCSNYQSFSSPVLGFVYLYGKTYYFEPNNNSYTPSYDFVNYTAAASDVVGLPDLEEKETELGYVPDINIPLPETVAEDTNIGDINDAADAVLDYAGTAGNTLDLEYEYVEDTNVDTGTDTETGEGTGTDAETGTQTGSVALENVAADSLVEVAPEMMLNDDTLMGLFISKFPWCIPFDLYFAVSAFAADPVAPEFEVNLFEGVSWEGLDLSGTEMTLSFEAFEKVAAVTRWSTLIIFCAGLAMITKRMIWS